MSDRHHRSMEIPEPLIEPTLVTREAHPAAVVRQIELPPGWVVDVDPVAVT